jgi:hypothetical protein
MGRVIPPHQWARNGFDAGQVRVHWTASVSSYSKLFETINAEDISIFDTVLAYVEQDSCDKVSYATV